MISIKLKCGRVVEMTNMDVTLLSNMTDFWLAVDADGELYAYTLEEPYISDRCWISNGGVTWVVDLELDDDFDWENSLMFVNHIDEILTKHTPSAGVVVACPDIIYSGSTDITNAPNDVSLIRVDDGWNYIEDDVYPEHNQHVIVWDMRSNVFDANGERVTGGDCWFKDQKVEWDKRTLDDRMQWKDDFDYFLSMNGPRYRWKGHGPCGFGEVVAWKPFPIKPSRLE